MDETPPERLRDYLENESPKLAAVLEALWLKSAPLHDRQNRPDSNENGRSHVETVEQNIWRLLTETWDKGGIRNLEHFKPREVFLLSAGACCHDFDKALKSGQPLPEPFQHGEGSAEFVAQKENFDALGIDEHQAKDIAAAIGIHDLKSGAFQETLETLSPSQVYPDTQSTHRRVAVPFEGGKAEDRPDERLLLASAKVPTSLSPLPIKGYVMCFILLTRAGSCAIISMAGICKISSSLTRVCFDGG